MPRETLSAGEARRVAIRAQGLDGPAAPGRSLGPGELIRTVRRLGLLQIDSVNVLARAHHLTLGARCPGPYEALRDTLDQAARRGTRRRLFEYWGHEASYLPVEQHALWRWRMDDARAGRGIYSKLARFAEEHADFIASVLKDIERRGPLTARELPGGTSGSGGWWGWSRTKTALEWLFWAGLVTTADRRTNFERVYDLPERALPRAALDVPTPSRAEAQRALLLIALGATGVATVRDLSDYVRMRPGEARERVGEIVEAGLAREVRVRGWAEPALAAADMRVPRHVHGHALLWPFDSLIWTRPRTERLFGMRVRLEIYTPAAKRLHGYYVLPFLLGDRLVGRVDLKADRQANVLIALAAHLEPDCLDDGRSPARGEIAESLASALGKLAARLGLGGVVPGPAAEHGHLAGPLRRLG